MSSYSLCPKLHIILTFYRMHSHYLNLDKLYVQNHWIFFKPRQTACPDSFNIFSTWTSKITLRISEYRRNWNGGSITTVPACGITNTKTSTRGQEYLRWDIFLNISNEGSTYELRRNQAPGYGTAHGNACVSRSRWNSGGGYSRILDAQQISTHMGWDWDWHEENVYPAADPYYTTPLVSTLIVYSTRVIDKQRSVDVMVGGVRHTRTKEQNLSRIPVRPINFPWEERETWGTRLGSNTREKKTEIRTAAAIRRSHQPCCLGNLRHRSAAHATESHSQLLVWQWRRHLAGGE